MKGIKTFLAVTFVTTAFAVGFTGCNSDGADSGALGRDGTSGSFGHIPPGGSGGGGANSGGPAIGPTCHDGDSNHICLALKYVSFKDGSGNPVLTQAQAVSNITAINGLWAQCDLGFQMDSYSAVDPTANGLTFNTANYADLDSIRNAYNDGKTLLVVTTGTWNRSGSLGDTGANAWTALPGGAPYGAILEAPVATFGNIIAHELGHYLNLQHVGDTTDLMTPIIYDNSTNLTVDQCTTARQAAGYFWQNMAR